MSSFWTIRLIANRGRRIIRATVRRVGSFLGVVASVSACTTPEQPDLNTYGAVLPVCVLACFQTFTLTEGDGATGSLSSNVSTSHTGGDKL